MNKYYWLAKELGLSNYQIAKRIGVSPATVLNQVYSEKPLRIRKSIQSKLALMVRIEAIKQLDNGSWVLRKLDEIEASEEGK